MLNNLTAEEYVANYIESMVVGTSLGVQLIMVVGLASWGIFLSLRFFKKL